MAGKLITVAGGQYGSEGKGAVAAYLSNIELEPRLLAVRVAGPNAGHTVIGTGPQGQADFAWKLRAVPVAAVTNRQATLLIAAGSEVDFSVLDTELIALDAAGYQASARLFVDREATMLEDDHIQEEQNSDLQDRLGSTAKGIGAARASRVWRRALTYADFRDNGVDGAAGIRGSLHDGTTVLIEGTQGYGLGLHAGEYPYCTSSDCRFIDFMAMAGISPWDPRINQLVNVLVFRTRPIRVAGNSGAMESETSWEQLGLPEERTTVTNKVRRVGEWDPELARRAIHANGGPDGLLVALTMVDQVMPELAGKDNAGILQDPNLAIKAADQIAEYEDSMGANAVFVGTGPATLIDRSRLGVRPDGQ